MLQDEDITNSKIKILFIIALFLFSVNAFAQDEKTTWETVYSDHGVSIFHRYEIMLSEYKIVQGGKEFVLDPMNRAEFTEEKINQNRSLLRIGYSGGSGTGIAVYRDFVIYVNKAEPVLMANILSGGYTANPMDDPIVHQAGVEGLSVNKTTLQIKYAYGIEGKAQKEYQYSVPMTKMIPEQDECEFIMKAIYGELEE